LPKIPAFNFFGMFPKDISNIHAPVPWSSGFLSRRSICERRHRSNPSLPALYEKGQRDFGNLFHLSLAPNPHLNAYGATTAYLMNFSTGLRQELKPRGRTRLTAGYGKKRKPEPTFRPRSPD
jgi:NAD(P)-dependent dehydrogenase (short-subunit alcohol dehydrogenase family)